VAWLIGFLTVLLAIVFWRATLVLVAILCVGGLVLYLYVQGESEQYARAKADEARRARQTLAAAQQTISAAQQNQTPKEWTVSTERDPASGQAVPRSAHVLSDDGLCTLNVEQRINGARLTGVLCGRLKIDWTTDIDVKFDNRDTSDRMRLQTFSDGDGVYIPSEQFKYSGELEYKEFLRRLASTSKVALQINFTDAGEHWITFSLSKSREALGTIGAI
jgi:hypothetical protein